MSTSSDPVASVVLSTRNRADQLRCTLESIACQWVPFPYEVIVVDDGSTDHTLEVCREAGVRAVHLDNPVYRNPGPARNVGYRLARAPVIIAQSDEVEHVSPDTVLRLVAALEPRTAVFARVWNVRGQERLDLYVGPERHRPLFFLGSLWREDLYAVGGNDEEFTEPGFEDTFFAQCLDARGVRFRFLDDVVGHHQHHEHHEVAEASRCLWEVKCERAAETGCWVASGGPWPFVQEEGLWPSLWSRGCGARTAARG